MDSPRETGFTLCAGTIAEDPTRVLVDVNRHRLLFGSRRDLQALARLFGEGDGARLGARVDGSHARHQVLERQPPISGRDIGQRWLKGPVDVVLEHERRAAQGDDEQHETDGEPDVEMRLEPDRSNRHAGLF